MSAGEAEEAATHGEGAKWPLLGSFAPEDHTGQHSTAGPCLLKGLGGCSSSLCCL